MTNAVKETLIFAAATIGLGTILMSAARAQDAGPTDADIASQTSAFSATVGSDLFDMNAAELPTPRELPAKADDYARNDTDAQPIWYVAADIRRVRSITLPPVRISSAR